jgi:hypothetical protein
MFTERMLFNSVRSERMLFKSVPKLLCVGPHGLDHQVTDLCHQVRLVAGHYSMTVTRVCVRLGCSMPSDESLILRTQSGYYPPKA